jgi:multiple sugar transport system substrate-binding protein
LEQKMDFLSTISDEISDKLLREKVKAAGEIFRQPINVLQFDWGEYWREIVNIGIYRRGADVAEIGSTWLESLVGMNALAEFSPRDLGKYGGRQDFFPSVWQNVTTENGAQVWGIPSRVDTRLIVYWKDMFAQAGVDPQSAFSSPGSTVAAFRQMKSRGISTPWGVPTAKGVRNTVYDIASWIWEAGGQFISPTTRALELNTKSTYKGMRAYFELYEFMPDEGKAYDDNDVLELFSQRKVAATIIHPLVFDYLNQKGLLEQMGAALPPGPAFVGGTVLVAFQHSMLPRESKDLIGYLSEPEFQKTYSRSSGFMPVRPDTWDDEFLHTHEFMPIFLKAIQNGRGLPPFALWGVIEDRLANTFGAIWSDIFSSPKPVTGAMLDTILSKHIEPMVARLEIAMKD